MGSVEGAHLRMINGLQGVLLGEEIKATTLFFDYLIYLYECMNVCVIHRLDSGCIDRVKLIWKGGVDVVSFDVLSNTFFA